MKKVILTMCVAGALLATSCKKAKEEVKDAKETTVETVEKEAKATTEEATKTVEETVDKATEAVKSAIEGVTIPEFKNPKVGEYLQSYSQYAKAYIDAKGDVLKNTELATKAAELATKATEITSSLDAESAVKFGKVMNAIQAKMAPAK
ncbi:hypothetical protein [Tenacibaculum insulae]|uniref:hypothetical protein n=1 Tax=Tenacibaculum insulae TaxID=2029677 RepID=UPI003AB85C02